MESEVALMGLWRGGNYYVFRTEQEAECVDRPLLCRSNSLWGGKLGRSWPSWRGWALPSFPPKSASFREKSSAFSSPFPKGKAWKSPPWNEDLRLQRPSVMPPL